MKWLVRILLTILLVFIVGFAVITYQQANNLVHHAKVDRKPPELTPAEAGIDVAEVSVVNTEGHKLYGFYKPSANGAYVMLQHGYKADTSDLFEEAGMLQRAGFGVLLTSVRAHGKNDGKQITFGAREMDDLEAWYDFVIAQGAIPGRVGILGNSMGASMSIQYAASNPDIGAAVSVSGFSSLQDTISVSVEYFTGLPAFPFAPAIASWAEWILGVSIDSLNSVRDIASLCETPVLIMQGGADIVVSVSSGQWLYDAACGEKEFWFEDDVEHVRFDRQKPAEFERRIVAFFNQHLIPN